MITLDKIQNTFNKYATLSADADPVKDRNLNALMMYALDSDHIDFDGDCLTLAKGAGPLEKIEIERIIGAEDFASHWAIILPSSVIFLNKRSGEVRVFLAEE